jgi:hypothetical protein
LLNAKSKYHVVAAEMQAVHNEAWYSSVVSMSARVIAEVDIYLLVKYLDIKANGKSK